MTAANRGILVRRRLRGIVGAACFWAVLWLPFGFLYPLLLGDPLDCLYCPADWFIRFLVAWVVAGAVSGALFAIVLMIAERRRSLDDLSLARMATWGAIGAVVLPLSLTAIDVLQWRYTGSDWQLAGLGVAITAGLGAICGASTLVLARRGAVRQ